MNVAECIVEALVSEGVTLAAGIAGNDIGKLLDAIAARAEIDLMYPRTERVALDICDGFARASGKIGVCYTDSGPAAANLMGAMVNSWGDATPVLHFAGHNNRTSVPSRTTKELPFLEVFSPITKYAEIIREPSQTAEIIRRAFMALRTGRPGPVVIGLPYDVSCMQLDSFHYRPVASRPAVRGGADPAAVTKAIELIGAARRPYVYVGAGVLVAEATEALVRFSELLTLPVATTLNGKSAFPENHPLSLGLGGFVRAAYTTLPAAVTADNADLILTIGAGFRQHATEKVPRDGVQHVQVDVEGLELNRHHDADVALLGDARVVIEQLIEAARTHLPAERLRPLQARLDELGELRARWNTVSEPLLHSREVPINPFRVTAELNRLVDPAKTIILHDSGTVRGSTAQHYMATTPRGFLGFGVASAMGWTVGAAMGARKACPDKLVVAIVGEEAFNETALDIETSVRAHAPVLFIVKNNRHHAWSERAGGKNRKLAVARYETGVDIGALARALGAESIRVENPDAIAEALASGIRTVKAGRTTVIDIVTSRRNGTLDHLWENKPGD